VPLSRDHGCDVVDSELCDDDSAHCDTIKPLVKLKNTLSWLYCPGDISGWSGKCHDESTFPRLPDRQYPPLRTLANSWYDITIVSFYGIP
jgi:hypothetical protein